MDSLGEPNIPVFLSFSGEGPLTIFVYVGLVITWIAIILKFYENAWKDRKAFGLVLIHDLWVATGVGLAVAITINLPGAVAAVNAAVSANKTTLTNETGLAAIYGKVAALEVRVATTVDLQSKIDRLMEENARLREEAATLRSEAVQAESPPSQITQQALDKTVASIRARCDNISESDLIGLLKENPGP